MACLGIGGSPDGVVGRRDGHDGACAHRQRARQRLQRGLQRPQASRYRRRPCRHGGQCGHATAQSHENSRHATVLLPTMLLTE